MGFRQQIVLIKALQITFTDLDGITRTLQLSDSYREMTSEDVCDAESGTKGGTI